MKALVAFLAMVVSLAEARAGTSILFIGNSFIFADVSPLQFYRADTITDLSNEGFGGVPALFKSFTRQAGLDYDVTLEAKGGTGLDFHLANRLPLIGRRGWDTVVMHGYSTLDSQKPRDPAKLVATTRQMTEFLRLHNPKVRLYLMATWPRADQTYLPTGAWAGQSIETMTSDISAAYDQAAAAAGVNAVLPVGAAWIRAIHSGFADPDPYDGIEAGKVNLWAYDNYHASVHGYYLEALVVFGGVTGRDPRSLGENECSAYEMGLSREQVKALQQLAFDQLASAGLATSAGPASRHPARPTRCAPTR